MPHASASDRCKEATPPRRVAALAPFAETQAPQPAADAAAGAGALCYLRSRSLPRSGTLSWKLEEWLPPDVGDGGVLCWAMARGPGDHSLGRCNLSRLV